MNPSLIATHGVFDRLIRCEIDGMRRSWLGQSASEYGKEDGVGAISKKSMQVVKTHPLLRRRWTCRAID